MQPPKQDTMVRTCTVNGVSYAVISTLPIPLYPPVIAAFAPQINRMISPGDTVRIFPDIVDCLLARVIDIEPNREAVFASSIPVHLQHIEAELSTRPFLKIQLILNRDQSIAISPGSEWPVLSEEIMMATRGIHQVAHTNCIMWISPEQIIDLVTIFHTSHCINHTFGSISGREDACFTCSNAIFDHLAENEVTEHKMEFVLPSAYLIFGPSTNKSNPVFITESEKNAEFKYTIHRIMHKLLTKAGKIGGTALYTGPLPKDQWCHFTNALIRLDHTLAPAPSAISTMDTAHHVLHGHLSLETKYLPTTITTITAKSPSQFDALRCLFSKSIGVGIRKRPPNRTDCKAGRRVFSIQEADVVNLVAIDLEGLEDDAEGMDWFPDDAVQVNHYFDQARNYIKF